RAATGRNVPWTSARPTTATRPTSSSARPRPRTRTASIEASGRSIRPGTRPAPPTRRNLQSDLVRPVIVEAGGGARGDDDHGEGLLDQRRAGDAGAGPERCAVVHRRVHEDVTE